MKGVNEALSAIHVERIDAFAEFRDRGDEIVALLDLEAHAFRDFGELLVRLPVDGAELVTFAAELGKAGVERVGVGEGLGFFRCIVVAMLSAGCACSGQNLCDDAFEFFKILVERGANLFRADLAKVRGDKTTRFDDSYRVQIRVVPEKNRAKVIP